MPITTIQIQNDALVPERVQGVLVEFYSTLGALVTTGTSDVNGEVTVTLPAATYDVLFYKIGISVLPRQPQQIIVLTQVPPNVFLVTVHVRVDPESTDPDLCRVSGFFIDSSGRPCKNLKFTLGMMRELAVFSGRIVAFEDQVTYVTDDKGYVEFDLLHGLDYEIFFVNKDTLLGMPPGRFCVKVPDLASIRLEDLLFPVPIRIEFSATTLDLETEQGNPVRDETTTYEVTYSDGVVRDTPTRWGTYTFTVSNPDVAELEVVGNKLIITGKIPGVCVVGVDVITGQSVYRTPATAQTDTLTITVI